MPLPPQKANWSCEPWTIHHGRDPRGFPLCTLISDEDEIVAASDAQHGCVVSDRPNMDRIRLAVNACAEIPSDLLAVGLIDDLFAAVRECFRRHGPLDTESCRRVAQALVVMDDIRA